MNGMNGQGASYLDTHACKICLIPRFVVHWQVKSGRPRYVFLCLLLREGGQLLVELGIRAQGNPKGEREIVVPLFFSSRPMYSSVYIFIFRMVVIVIVGCLWRWLGREVHHLRRTLFLYRLEGLFLQIIPVGKSSSSLLPWYRCVCVCVCKGRHTKR